MNSSVNATLDDGMLTSRQLTWRRFKRHRLALASGWLLLVIYVVALTCEFFSTYDPGHRNPRAILAPPQEIHFFDEEGVFHQG